MKPWEDEVEVSRLADEFGMSKDHIRHIMKMEAGCSMKPVISIPFMLGLLINLSIVMIGVFDLSWGSSPLQHALGVYALIVGCSLMIYAVISVWKK